MINYVVLLQNTEKEVIYGPDVYHETPKVSQSCQFIDQLTIVDTSYMSAKL